MSTRGDSDKHEPEMSDMESKRDVADGEGADGVPKFPKFKYTSIKHAWKELNKDGDKPGDFDRFRKSHGWVRGVKREVEPFKDEKSYKEAIEVYNASVKEGQDAQKKFHDDYPDLFQAYKDKIQNTRRKNKSDPAQQEKRERQKRLKAIANGELPAGATPGKKQRRSKDDLKTVLNLKKQYTTMTTDFWDNYISKVLDYESE